MNSDTKTHTTTPSILGSLILTRMIANSKGPGRGDLVKDLKFLIPATVRGSDSDWKQLVYRTLEELSEQNHITDPVRKIEITDSGRQHLRDFLNVETLPEKMRWSVLKKRHLIPLALGSFPSGKPEVTNASTGDGFKAAMLVKFFNLPINAYPSLPQAIQALAAMQGLKMRNNTHAAMQDALLENWISSSDQSAVFSARSSQATVADPLPVASATATTPMPLNEFAARVRRPAGNLRDDRHGEKVLISRIWERFRADADVAGISRSEFDQLLLQSNREQLLALGRADLPGTLDPKEYGESEVQPPSGDRFHFVRADTD